MPASKWNTRNPSVKRILKEYKELQMDPNPLFTCAPLDDNIFEWHFTMRGPRDTPYEGGIYHGRLLLPTGYPLDPPDIIMLTPNGRFQTDTKICLSNLSYHPEEWQASWGVRSIIMGFISMFPTEGEGAIGSIKYSDKARRKLAQESLDYRCPECGVLCREVEFPPEPEPSSESKSKNEEKNNENIDEKNEDKIIEQQNGSTQYKDTQGLANTKTEQEQLTNNEKAKPLMKSDQDANTSTPQKASPSTDTSKTYTEQTNDHNITKSHHNLKNAKIEPHHKSPESSNTETQNEQTSTQRYYRQTQNHLPQPRPSPIQQQQPIQRRPIQQQQHRQQQNQNQNIPQRQTTDDVTSILIMFINLMIGIVVILLAIVILQRMFL